MKTARVLYGALAVCFFGAFAACGGGDDGAADAAATPAWTAGVSLPVALGNNAVTAIEGSTGCTLYSVMGIGGALTAADIVASAYRWNQGDAAWTAMPDLPTSQPRVAAHAVGLRGKLHVIGGYSVGPGVSEVSFDAMDVYDPDTNQWSAGRPLPVPIDDAVVVVWRDRWIIVVTGWSNTGNVDAVQIYDADTDEWSMGTAFPGIAVFGPTGALVGDELLVIDGVGDQEGFNLVNQAWLGQLDPQDPTTIAWTDLGTHPGPPRYRAAGEAASETTLWFHGGTDDPYNYNGRSYDTGQPSAPLDNTLVYDVGSRQFSALGIPKPTATMDHRALARCGETLYTVGGLVAGPAATADVWLIEAR